FVVVVAARARVIVAPPGIHLRHAGRSEVDEVAGGFRAAVLGGGSMGLLHLLVIKAARPAAKVLVVDPVAERRALAERLGADATAAPGEPAVEAARALAGDGVDAVFDTVGGGALLRAALTLTREGGSVVLFAHAPDGEPADFDLNDLFKYERRIIGSYSGALAEQARVFELIAAGRLDPVPLVSHTFPLDQFEAGYALARNRQALKVLFTPSSKAGAG
ncbi:MAG: zinc-binding dehydrogenase, partial [Rhodospirillaceae bacterium]